MYNEIKNLNETYDNQNRGFVIFCWNIIYGYALFSDRFVIHICSCWPRVLVAIFIQSIFAHKRIEERQREAYRLGRRSAEVRCPLCPGS